MMSLAKEMENVTGQGLGTPEPVGAGSGVAGSPRPSSNDCFGKMVGNQDPFKRRDNIPKSPPPRRGSESEISKKEKAQKKKKTETETEKIEKEEQLAFEGLGKNIAIIDGILKDAKNIHKPIREATVAAVIYYQKLMEIREHRGRNKESLRNIDDLQKKKIATGTNRTTQTEENLASKTNKTTQTEIEAPKNRRKVAKENTRRISSSSLDTPRDNRKEKTAQRQNIQLYPINTIEIPGKEEDDPPWQRVDHRKKKRRKGSERVGQRNMENSEEKGPKKVQRRRLPDAVAVKLSDGTTYANVLKELRTKIDPSKIGVQVSGIRKTQTGEILIEIKNGGSTEELRSNVAAALGQGMTVRTLDRSVSLVVKDLDGATDESKVAEAIKAVITEEDQKETVKVRALRKIYGEAQMAIVTMSLKAADTVLNIGRIKIGWVMCRVREREGVTQCFNCLGYGHLARNCNGPDRTKLCRLCGKEGHFSKECKNQPFCVLCSAANEPTGAEHILGSRKCEARRKQIIQTAK